MHTIVGLGNPGEEYARTRHNAGRIVLAKALDAFGWSVDGLRPGRVVTGEVAGKSAQALFPATYMNDSGRAVAQLVSPEDASSLIVVYDEVDLPLGEIKVSFGRGAGGHNGLASVIAALGTKDFARIRIGIARKNFWGRLVRPQGEGLADYVLGRLSKSELARLEELSGTVREAIEAIVKEGVQKAMNKFNQ